MKIARVIGRFQPFHLGHLAMVKKALQVADHVVIMIGDTGFKQTIKNPWTVGERMTMISQNFSNAEIARIVMVGIQDTNPYYETALDDWVDHVRSVYTQCVQRLSNLPGSEVVEHILVGYNKDESSYYLDLFPECTFISADPVLHGEKVIDATAIREVIFDPDFKILTDDLLGRASFEYVRKWVRDEMSEYCRLYEEYQDVKTDKKLWDCLAVQKWGGPVKTTVDIVLHDGENVLLITRNGDYGRDAIATPGGFVEPNQWVLEAALAELEQETCIQFNPDIMEMKPLQLFDNPKRSLRGRVITFALEVKLKVPFSESGLNYKGADDAADAFITRIDQLHTLKHQFFSDHYFILQKLFSKELVK